MVYYGEAPKYAWIDSFHTGYNLDSLKRYVDHANDREFSEEAHARLPLLQGKFFRAGRSSQIFALNRLYPIDIQCLSQAIDTLAFFSEADADALSLAQRTAMWTITNMQDEAGFFYYRDSWLDEKTTRRCFTGDKAPRSRRSRTLTGSCATNSQGQATQRREKQSDLARVSATF